MATPIFTATPAPTASYNPGMAETFSWVPMEGAGRPLFAKAVNEVGGGGAGAGGANGFDFVVPSSLYSGPYSSVQVASACRIAALTATGVSTTTVQSLTSYDLPAGFSFTATIQGIRLSYGTVIAYK